MLLLQLFLLLNECHLILGHSSTIHLGSKFVKCTDHALKLEEHGTFDICQFLIGEIDIGPSMFSTVLAAQPILAIV